ncbi:MAG: CBS domain-containing protein [Myxococcota bacterium]|nr:CBS domain-containing protein [Myxococcota bacterium]
MRHHTHHVPRAREFMTRNLITLKPDMGVLEAVALFLKNSISGAPVVDENGRLIGVFSELDCLKVLAAGEFYADDYREEGVVGDFMSRSPHTVTPDADVYTLAQRFLDHALRRIPVLDGEELVGQISRRDVLRAMERLGESRVQRKHYPDYREPSPEVGARRAH